MIFNNVKKLCDEQHITIAGLEVKAGLANGTVRKRASTKRGPLLPHVKKVADILGVSMDELIGDSYGKEE